MQSVHILTNLILNQNDVNHLCGFTGRVGARALTGIFDHTVLKRLSTRISSDHSCCTAARCALFKNMRLDKQTDIMSQSRLQTKLFVSAAVLLFGPAVFELWTF